MLNVITSYSIHYTKLYDEVVFGTQRIAQEAIKIDSPLDAENFLNTARLAFLESLTVGHYFDLTSYNFV